MKTIRWNLLRWLVGYLFWPSVAASGVWVVYVLLAPLLDWREIWEPLLVLGYCNLIVLRLGRVGKGDMAFLYTRGFSRDCLWAHTMLASTAAVLIAWAPAALVVWTGLRSFIQDVVFQSPYHPLMDPLEAYHPLIWLAGYVLLIPVFHYAWVRWAQPTRGAFGGSMVAKAVVVAAFVAYVCRPWPTWLEWLIVASGVVVAIASALAGWRLHRCMEVRS